MTGLAKMWTRSMPVHPEAKDALRELKLLPDELIDLILDFASKPEPLTLHYGDWCTASAPCAWCRGLMRVWERRYF